MCCCAVVAIMSDDDLLLPFACLCVRARVCVCASVVGSGDYFSDGICYGCGPGTFNDGSSLGCMPCGAGLASDYGASVCVSPPEVCGDGEYVAYSYYGTYCAPCSSADSYCYHGACLGDCGYCAFETFANDFGAAACTNANSSSCPAGTGAIEGGVLSLYGCYDCPAGSYSDGSGLSCEPCAAGTTSSPGSSNCSSACPPGQYLCSELRASRPSCL